MVADRDELGVGAGVFVDPVSCIKKKFFRKEQRFERRVPEKTDERERQRVGIRKFLQRALQDRSNERPYRSGFLRSSKRTLFPTLGLRAKTSIETKAKVGKGQLLGRAFGEPLG